MLLLCVITGLYSLCDHEFTTSPSSKCAVHALGCSTSDEDHDVARIFFMRSDIITVLGSNVLCENLKVLSSLEILLPIQEPEES
jgi:hypothetical protein